MIQLTHLTGSRTGQVDKSPKAVVRLGRGPDCDVRFDGSIDRTVSSHHAEIRFDGNDGYMLVDTQSSNGTLVNGARVSQHQLQPGDVIFLGGDVGPQLRFEVGQLAAPAPRARPQAAPARAPGSGSGGGQDDDVLNAAQEAVKKARASRQAAGGAAPTGQTMFMMVDAINQVVEKKQSNFKRNIAVVVGVAVVVIGIIVTAWMIDRSKYSTKIDEKKNLDGEIAKIQQELDVLGDGSENEDRRKELVGKLELISGKAEKLTEDLESSVQGKEALKKAGADNSADFVDSELKKIMRDFEADTYAVPKNFKDRVQFYLDDWKKRGSLKVVWERRRRYWPMIKQAFDEEQVPDVMAYVAWQESQFDPEICSWVGARGMWQFMPATARRYNLHVDGSFDSCKPPPNGQYCPCNGVDERTDPYKAAKAGAKYLGDLLAEFGMDSFMLAIASYNKGEEGMRKILREKRLRRHSDRDFWHLYYLKYLPEETLEYVPRIVAAAIVGRNPQKFDLQP